MSSPIGAGRMRARRLVVTVAALVPLALFASCSSSSKSSTPSTIKESGFQIATPDGTAAMSLDGKLPPGWPGAFPIPSDAKVAGSGSLSNSEKSGMVAVYTISGSASDTFDFYKTNTAYTVTSSSSAGVGSAFVGTVQFDGAYTGSATLAGRNAKTYLAIVLKPSTGATTTTGVGDTTTTGPTESTLAAS
jgi:hypothetical protein